MSRSRSTPLGPSERIRLVSRLRRIQIISTRLVESLLGGNYRSVFRGQGIEFDEVREYVPGDDVRLIDWNVTSRMGEPFTKVFREERELSLSLIVDVSASLRAGTGDVGKDESALLIFAIMALAAVANNDRVGAVFYSDRIEKWAAPAKGPRHVQSLLNDLASTRSAGIGSELALAMRSVSSSLKRRGIVMILSDFKTDGYWNELTLMARRHDVVAVRITDPSDFVFPEVGAVELRDPESGKTILATGLSREFRDRYSEDALVHHERWLAECRRRGVETLEIPTSEDPATRLYDFFQRRRRRR